jgi:membrane fusion protein, multidrug efflux system
MSGAGEQRREPSGARPGNEVAEVPEPGSRSLVPVEQWRAAVVRWLPDRFDLPLPPMDSEQARRYRRRTLVGLLLVLLLAPVISWVHYESRHVTSTNAAVRGYISDIGTQVDGLVASVEVDAGDRVRAGQILVRLEDRHFRAEVREATAELGGLTQEIEAERLTIAHERQRVAQHAREAEARLTAAEANTAAAEIRADDARENFKLRESLLSRGGAISGEDVRDAETSRLTADALLREARARYIAAESAQASVQLDDDGLAIREQRIGVLEADVLRAEARLTRAEADLEAASIRAPADGAVLRRIVQPGASVEAGEPILSMLLGEDLWVEAWVDEDEIGAVRVGSEVTVTLRSVPGREFAGVVDRIAVATDLEMPAEDVPQPRFHRMRGAPVVGVRVRLHEPPEDLRPGMSAVVAIREGS